MSDTIKYFLEESKMPKSWYNIAADLPKPMEPPLHPGTLKPIGPDDLAPLFPMALIPLLVIFEMTFPPIPLMSILASSLSNLVEK